MGDRNKDHVVTGAYVTMATMTSDGYRVMGFMLGSPVPKDVSQEVLDHLVAHGLATEVGLEPVVAGQPSADQLRRQADDELAAAKVGAEAAQTRVDNAQEAVKAVQGLADQVDEQEQAREKARAEAAQRLSDQQGDRPPAADQVTRVAVVDDPAEKPPPTPPDFGTTGTRGSPDARRPGPETKPDSAAPSAKTPTPAPKSGASKPAGKG